LTASTTIEQIEAKALGTAAGIRRRRYLAVVLGWLGFIGFWWLAAIGVGREIVLPSPPRVLQEILTIFSESFWPEFSASLIRVFGGFIVGGILGAPLGYLMGRSRYWNAFLQAPVMVAGATPGLTYAVLAFVVFGIGFFGPLVVVALVSLPYIAINVAEGVAGVDKGLLKMSQAYGRTDRQILRHVFIPTILPYAFAGIRLAFSLAWKVGTLTEVFGASRGIGFQVRRNFQLFNVPGVLAWVLIFVLFMILLERQVLARTERHLFRWRQGEV
jgi:NitT/TauT family transport system permease protein